MCDPQAEAAPCRTCGNPRGENVAGGTRCTACGRAQARVLWLASSLAAAGWAFLLGHGAVAVATVFLIALAVVPAAFVTAVLLHELTHAAVAVLLGQAVSRIVIGEGAAWLRLGRDPQVVLGSVVMGNGLTLMCDARRTGYRMRSTLVLLAAPVVSLVLAAAAWQIGAGMPLAGRAASVVFAVANLALGIVTLVPVPTFGGRVWSDLAVVLFLARADEAAVSEHMVLIVRERIEHLLDIGDRAAALALAREAADQHPGSPLAAALLAYMLHHEGQVEEAAAVAHAALDGNAADAEKAYLRQFLVTDGTAAAPGGADPSATG